MSEKDQQQQLNISLTSRRTDGGKNGIGTYYWKKLLIL